MKSHNGEELAEFRETSSLTGANCVEQHIKLFVKQIYFDVNTMNIFGYHESQMQCC